MPNKKVMYGFKTSYMTWICGHRGKKISYLFPKRVPSPQKKSDSPQAMTNFMMPQILNLFMAVFK